MSAAVVIGWCGLSVTTQDRLVRDAWLLMAWWIVVGLAWLGAFSRVVRSQPGRLGPAPEPPAGAARSHRRRGVGGGADPAIGVVAIIVAIEIATCFESGATLFWLTLITVAVTAATVAGPVWLVGMDRLMSNSDGVILANLTHQFVFDRATERGMLPHRPPSESVPTILRESLGRGVTFLVFSAVGPVTLMLMLPGAASLAEILR